MFIAIKRAFILTAIVALSTGSAASAGEFQSNGRHAEVRFGDLDLSQPAGQKQLRQRINRATAKVCTSSNSLERNACRKLALANVSAPVAAAMARAQTGERYADAAKDARIALSH